MATLNSFNQHFQTLSLLFSFSVLVGLRFCQPDIINRHFCLHCNCCHSVCDSFVDNFPFTISFNGVVCFSWSCWMDGWKEGRNSSALCVGSGGAALQVDAADTEVSIRFHERCSTHSPQNCFKITSPPLHTSHPSLVSEINVRISSDFSRDSSQCWSGLAMESDQASIQSNPFSQELAKQNQLNIHRIRISFQNINIPSASGPQRCDSSDVSVP
jgi:hypothetical protein